MPFADRLHELRVAKGWTQAETATRCGLHQSQISAWQKGRSLPDVVSLLKLAAGFQVPVDDMVVGLVPAYDEASKRRHADLALDPARALNQSSAQPDSNAQTSPIRETDIRGETDIREADERRILLEQLHDALAGARATARELTRALVLRSKIADARAASSRKSRVGTAHRR